MSLASQLRTDFGWDLYNRAAHAQARSWFQDALALSEANERAWCGLGWAQLRLGRLGEAAQAFDHLIGQADALEMRTVQEAFRGRAWSHYWAGRCGEAVRDFTSALGHTDPAHDGAAIADILLGRSRAAYRAGLVDMALEDARRARGADVSRLSLMLHVHAGRLKRRIRNLVSQ
jgi:tetratricopeptide (TPR) repeat protein